MNMKPNEVLDDIYWSAKCAFDDVYDGENFSAALRHAIESATKQLAEQRAELLEALKFARKELSGLPHSLGYEFTHIPQIDAVIAKVTGGTP